MGGAPSLLRARGREEPGIDGGLLRDRQQGLRAGGRPQEGSVRPGHHGRTVRGLRGGEHWGGDFAYL